MAKFLSFNPSRRCDYEILLQSNSEGVKGVTVHAGTTSKICEQNTVATLMMLTMLGMVLKAKENIPNSKQTR